MKIPLAALIIATLFVGCKRASLLSKVSESNLKAYYTSHYIKNRSVKLDSFRLVSVEEFTETDAYQELYQHLRSLFANKFDSITDNDNIINKYSPMADALKGKAAKVATREKYIKIIAQSREKNNRLMPEASLLFADARMFEKLYCTKRNKKVIAYSAYCDLQEGAPNVPVTLRLWHVLFDKDFNIINNRQLNAMLPPFKLLSDAQLY